nr:hypothetical protein [uncultured Duganella sp.]
MAEMNREEVDAKIATSEARNTAQLEAFRASVDALIARMDRFEERIHQDMREFKHDVGAMIADLKKTVIITCISATLATVFGVAAFNAALLSNMHSSFDSGTEAGQWRRDMQQQNEANRKILADNQKMLAENQKMQAENRQMLDELKQERVSGRR